MQRTATITFSTEDDSQRVAALKIDYAFDPPLTETETSTLRVVVGYLLHAITKVSIGENL